MLEFIEDAIRLLWGQYFFNDYSYIAHPLLEVILIVFAILIIILAFKFWKFVLFGWWRK